VARTGVTVKVVEAPLASAVGVAEAVRVSLASLVTVKLAVADAGEPVAWSVADAAEKVVKAVQEAA